MYRMDVACDGARNVVSQGLCVVVLSDVGKELPEDVDNDGDSSERLGGIDLSFSSAVRMAPPRKGLYLSTSMRRTAS